MWSRRDQGETHVVELEGRLGRNTCSGFQSEMRALSALVRVDPITSSNVTWEKACKTIVVFWKSLQKDTSKWWSDFELFLIYLQIPTQNSFYFFLRKRKNWKHFVYSWTIECRRPQKSKQSFITYSLTPKVALPLDYLTLKITFSRAYNKSKLLSLGSDHRGGKIAKQ